MKILTWNVLHRVHAETHAEPAIVAWPDEARRVQAIVARLTHALDVEGFEAALLQEVSGDLLAALRAQLTGKSVLNHPSPRVPRKKGDSVQDPTEHLVVIAPPGAKVLRGQTFATDPGKGFLFAGLPGGLGVISTHVSWGEKRAAQLAVLAQVLREAPGAVALGGDFNAEREDVAKAFEPPVVFGALPPGSPRTRPQEDASGGSDIDHLLCSKATIGQVRVLEHSFLSDHRPVGATITP